jgi:hypothetical protein
MLKESITYPMNAIQWETYEEWNQDRTMTEYNTTVAVDMPHEKVGADVIAAACQQVLDSQRYLHAHLVETTGEIQICEDWEMPNLVRRYTMTDATWDQDKEKMIHPFDLFHEPSVRLHVVDTETRTILIVETHHLLFDGISHKAVWSACEDVLCGKKPYQQDDLAAHFNRREIAAYDSEPYRRAQSYYQNYFGHGCFTDICREDCSPWGKTLVARPHFPASVIDEGCQRLGVSFAVIFNAAYALALGEMAGEKESVAFYNVSHGRDRHLNNRVYGNFLSCLPVVIDIRPEQTIGELIAKTKLQMFTSMRNKVYPLYHLLRDLDLEDIGTEMSPQGAYIYEFFHVYGTEYPSYHIETNLSLQHLSTCVLIRDKEYEVALDGSSALYDQGQIDELSQLTGELALRLVGDQEETLSNIIPLKS